MTNDAPAFLPVPDPFGRFCAIYGELDRDRKFFQDSTALRYAALTATSAAGEPAAIAAEIREVGEELLARTKWFGALKSDVRFVVAAMLNLHDTRAVDLLDAIESGRQLFREADLRRAGETYESLTILILHVLNGGGSSVSASDVARLQAIYEEMKRHHWWLTGPEDFPACAMLAVSTSASPVAIGEGIEEIYQALRSAGFSAGDPLQTAANILFLSGVSAATLAGRYRALADEFKAAGISIWSSDYDELAILSFLDHDAKTVVARVAERRIDVEAIKPKPDRFMSFNLAVSIAFMELVQLDATLQAVTDAKALADIQAVISAQQAANMAAISAAISATTVATSGGG